MSKQFEGTWEEVTANASGFAGHRVRVMLLEDEPNRGQRTGTLDRMAEPDHEAGDVSRSVIPGRNHGKLYKNWSQTNTGTDISPSEFDSLDRAIAENRTMRRDLAQDSND